MVRVPILVLSKYAKSTRIAICGITNQSNLESTRLSDSLSIWADTPIAVEALSPESKSFSEFVMVSR